MTKKQLLVVLAVVLVLVAISAFCAGLPWDVVTVRH